MAPFLWRIKKNRRGGAPEAFDHIGLLANRPPRLARLPFS